MIVYRKTKEDKWAVFGPASEVKVGTVTVTKKDQSTKQERVVAVSKSFNVDGVPHCYGYLEEKKAEGQASTPQVSKPQRGNAQTKQCWECGRRFTYADAKANDGDWNDSYCGC